MWKCFLIWVKFYNSIKEFILGKNFMNVMRMRMFLVRLIFGNLFGERRDDKNASNLNVFVYLFCGIKLLVDFCMRFFVLYFFCANN